MYSSRKSDEYSEFRLREQYKKIDPRDVRSFALYVTKLKEFFEKCGGEIMVYTSQLICNDKLELWHVHDYLLAEIADNIRLEFGLNNFTIEFNEDAAGDEDKALLDFTKKSAPKIYIDSLDKAVDIFSKNHAVITLDDMLNNFEVFDMEAKKAREQAPPSEGVIYLYGKTEKSETPSPMAIEVCSRDPHTVINVRTLGENSRTITVKNKPLGVDDPSFRLVLRAVGNLTGELCPDDDKAEPDTDTYVDVVLNFLNAKE